MSTRPTEEQLFDYKDHGFFVLDDVFTSAECEGLIHAAESLPSALDGTYSPCMMPHRLAPPFLATLKDPRIVSVMEILLCGPVSGLQTQYFFCRPGTIGFSIHQDNYFVQAPQDAFASAWLALVDIQPEKGSMRVSPGLHCGGLLAVRETRVEAGLGQDPNAVRIEAIVPEGSPVVNVSVSRGSVIFLHGDLPHGSNDNRSKEWRHSLLATYLRSGSPFRPGRDARREEIPNFR